MYAERQSRRSSVRLEDVSNVWGPHLHYITAFGCCGASWAHDVNEAAGIQVAHWIDRLVCVFSGLAQTDQAEASLQPVRPNGLRIDYRATSAWAVASPTSRMRPSSKPKQDTSYSTRLPRSLSGCCPSRSRHFTATVTAAARNVIRARKVTSNMQEGP